MLIIEQLIMSKTQIMQNKTITSNFNHCTVPVTILVINLSEVCIQIYCYYATYAVLYLTLLYNILLTSFKSNCNSTPLVLMSLSILIYATF